MVPGERIPRPIYKNATPDDQAARSRLKTEASLAEGIVGTNSAASPQAHAEPLWHLQHDQLFDFGDVDFNDDFFLGDDNMHLDVPSDLGSPANSPSEPFLESVDSHVPSSVETTHIYLRNEKAPAFPDSIISPRYTPQDFQELANHAGSVRQSSEQMQGATAGTSGQASWQDHNPENDHVLRDQRSSFSDTPQMVKQLFDKHICNVLSIKDDQTTNPWVVHVWPMIASFPALYHALAAMTYLYLSNSHLEFKAAGSRHLHSSLQAFTQAQSDESLEASLAARLALGFAESWNDQTASSGIEHIKIAGRLLRDAFDKDRITRLTGDELDRLSFLARTWVYKSVLIRLTTSDDGESVDLESMVAYIQLDRLPVEQQIDPLLGCAITLFPLIARLTDIIRSVRRRTEKYNSPSIISRGADLWKEIQGWSPSFDPEQPGNVPSHIADIIQTAEAYRWAALLLLRHAVPELPWAHSLWDLSEKALIYLATTPVTSRALVVQTFPLMAIGGEAFDEEDRNWICQRWNAMAKRMPLSRLHKCKKVTKEVWRRKDAFEAQLGACPSCGAHGPRSTGISPSMDTLPDADVSVASSQEREEGSRRCRCSAVRRSTVPASIDFPDSLAFKKGIDNITRAGNMHYMMRGELHWLTVMEDWNWQVPLG
ncbi:hypothetical protein AYO22_04659 [Fonsecaea multimorphosa]|nr:hypothetical protein AYO22_04659 [Fonsecaea multimorphosa]